MKSRRSYECVKVQLSNDVCMVSLQLMVEFVHKNTMNAIVHAVIFLLNFDVAIIIMLSLCYS